ncbi:MAG: prepilin-type N-terminal cleavage/methylation domain-containing protein [Phycisphaerales bacterium JB037]
MRATTRQPAFSLIELVVVATILSIVAAIALPKFAGASARQRLAAAEQRVLADIEAARQEARATSRVMSIEFHITAERYVVTGGAQFRRVVLSEDPYRARIESVSGLTDRTLWIDPNGESADTMTLVLAAGNEQRTITVPATVESPGLVVVLDPVDGLIEPVLTGITDPILGGVGDLLGN